MPFTLNINGKTLTADVEPDTPLLWVLRDTLGLTGTKFGCGIGSCGACTVHLDGAAMRACMLPVEQAAAGKIVTIEGLSENASHPVQQAWLEFDTPQCGYCQPGMIMAAAALLASNAQPSDEDINTEVSNACRCGTYRRVRQAIHRAAQLLAERG